MFLSVPVGFKFRAIATMLVLSNNFKSLALLYGNFRGSMIEKCKKMQTF